MKKSRKILSYAVTIVLVIGAMLILPVFEKLMPDGKEDLYVKEGAVTQKDQHIEPVTPAVDGILVNFPEAKNMENAVQIRDYDFIGSYVRSCMECLTVSEDLPNDTLDLRSHIFYDEAAELVFIYDVEYINSSRGKMRLDMCFSYEGRINIKPSLKYYICRPMGGSFPRKLGYSTSAIEKSMFGMTDFIMSAVTNYEVNIFEKGKLAVFLGLDSETVMSLENEYYDAALAEAYDPLYFLLWRFCRFGDGLYENIEKNENDSSSIYLEKMYGIFWNGGYRIEEYKDGENTELGLTLYYYMETDEGIDYDEQMTLYFNPVSGVFTGIYFNAEK